MLAGWLGTPADPAAILAAWEPALFNQTHDLASGVMTDHVYEDTIRSYEYSRRRSDDPDRRELGRPRVADRYPRAGDADRRLQSAGLDALGRRRGRGRLRRGGRRRGRADRPRRPGRAGRRSSSRPDTPTADSRRRGSRSSPATSLPWDTPPITPRRAVDPTGPLPRPATAASAEAVLENDLYRVTARSGDRRDEPGPRQAGRLGRALRAAAMSWPGSRTAATSGSSIGASTAAAGSR